MDYGETKDVSPAAYSYIKRLQRKGWHEVGSGLYSVVLSHPDFPYLVRKVSMNDYDPWQIYAKWVVTQNDPHLPKIFNYTQRKGYAFADMEKLVSVNFDVDVHYENYHHVSQLFYAYKPANSQPPKSFIHTVSTIKKAMRPHKLQLDIHEGNIMFRQDNTLVITDPYG